MTVQVNGSEMTLAGTVGADWFDDGFTHAQVMTALANMDGDITVRLNSGGGIASEGAAIHAALFAYSGSVGIVVEGIAASAASLIAMAGDTVTMSDGAVMMIHDPLNITIGNSADHAKTIEELEAYATAYAKVYALKSGMTAAECRAIMKAETWYDGDQAVAAGFADATGTIKASKAAAFDYRVYAKAPKRLVAQAKARNWSISDHIETEKPAATTAASVKDKKMTDAERAEAAIAELAKMKADLAKATADLASATSAATAAADAAVKADRERHTAIMALEETKGREALAEYLFTDGVSVEKAKAMLAVSPVAVAAVTDPADEYETQRLAGALLNGGGAGNGASGGTKASWAKSIAKANKSNKR